MGAACRQEQAASLGRGKPRQMEISRRGTSQRNGHLSDHRTPPAAGNRSSVGKQARRFTKESL